MLRTVKMRSLLSVAVYCLLFGAVLIAISCKKGDSTDPVSVTYTVNYDLNGGTGTVPESVSFTSLSGDFLTATAAAGTGLTGPSSQTFNGWNTQPGGFGISITAGSPLSTALVATFSAGTRTVTLYAQWR